MKRTITNLVAMSAMVALCLMLLPTAAVAHTSDCANKTGTEKARCERHEFMYKKCGPLKGDAHFACDREFLIAKPLDCKKQTGKEAEKCEAEVKAFKTCEPKAGREFMKCVKETTGESPMGH
jgi:hypothetical protein